MTIAKWIGAFSLMALPALSPAWTASAWADDLAPIALNSLTKPPANITSAKVMNPKGQVIGDVCGVVTDASGKVIAVKVAAGNSTTTIPAIAASYDAQRNIVVADATPVLAINQ
jgi:PRC-barrel domain protein